MRITILTLQTDLTQEKVTIKFANMSTAIRVYLAFVGLPQDCERPAEVALLRCRSLTKGIGRNFATLKTEWIDPPHHFWLGEAS